MKKQEHEMLEAKSVPMRHYLMKYVMPTAIEGLVDCCKVKPDDPVEFLVAPILSFVTLDHRSSLKKDKNICSKYLIKEKFI